MFYLYQQIMIDHLSYQMMYEGVLSTDALLQVYGNWRHQQSQHRNCSLLRTLLKQLEFFSNHHELWTSYQWFCHSVTISIILIRKVVSKHTFNIKIQSLWTYLTRRKIKIPYFDCQVVHLRLLHLMQILKYVFSYPWWVWSLVAQKLQQPSFWETMFQF